jgi:manganese/zinc/iron transport system substrate-binding protein
MMRKVICFCAAFLIAACGTFFLSGCYNGGYIYHTDKINITATTTMLGDLASVIGGEKIAVTTLMSAGVDPHSYQPRPSDAQALVKADLALINGLHLEAKMGDIIQKLGEKTLVIGDQIPKDRLLHDDEGAVDPHIWFDVQLWKIASDVLCKKLCDMDKKNEKYYQSNLSAYLTELDSLDAYIREKVSHFPINKRILVTAHDAFGYFAAAYGFTVYSIQGLSTQTEASAKDIQNIANIIVRLKVPAVFVESSVPVATINSLIKAAEAQGHTVKVGGELYSDSLGDKSKGTETYLKAVKYNVDTILSALGGQT